VKNTTFQSFYITLFHHKKSKFAYNIFYPSLTLKYMNPFKNLSIEDYEALLRFPAYILLYVANKDGRLDEAEKRSAINFSHIKTYSYNPLLTEFYRDANVHFAQTIINMDRNLPKDKFKRGYILEIILEKLERLTLKLGTEYAALILQSMTSFKEHVSDSHHSVLLDFVFPLPIHALTIAG